MNDIVRPIRAQRLPSAAADPSPSSPMRPRPGFTETGSSAEYFGPAPYAHGAIAEIFSPTVEEVRS